LAIVPDTGSGLASSDVELSHGSDTGLLFGLDKQIPYETCPHGRKRSPTCP